MTQKKPTHFRMQMDDSATDSLIQEEILDTRIERLGHRITLLAILIPVFIVVVLVLTYFDLTKRVISFQDTGSTGLSSLEKNLEDRFSSLSVKQAKLEESYGHMALSVKKALENDKETLKQSTRQIKTLEDSLLTSIDKSAQSKADRTELKAAVSKLKKTINSVKKELQTITVDLKALNKTITKELNLLNGSLADFNELLADLNKRIDQETTRISKLQEDISDVSIEKIDQNDLHNALEEEKTIYRQMISLITKNLEKRMDTLQEEIQEIEKNQQSIKEKAGAGPPIKPPPISPVHPEKPPKSSLPGQITEKTIPQS